MSVMVLAFMMLNFADRAVLGFAAVPLMHELNIPPSTYGLIASSFFLLFQVSSLTIGFLARRWSVRWVLFALALGWAVAQVPVLLAASVLTLVTSRVLLGASEGPAAPMAMHTLYTWFPPHRRGLPSSLHIVGAALGVLFAAPVLTWLIQHHGWRSGFLVLALLSGLWACLWLVLGGQGPVAVSPGGSADSGAQLTVSYRRIFATRTFVGGTVASFGAYWAVALSTAWLPAYLETGLGLSPRAVALMVMGIAATSTVLLLTVVPIVERVAVRGDGRDAWGLLMGGAVGASGLAMLAFPTLDGAARVICIVAAFALCVLAYPCQYLTAAAIAPPDRRAGVFGTMVALTTLAGVVAPAVTGWIVGTGGFPAAFHVGGVLMLLSGTAGLTLVRPRSDAALLGLPLTAG